MKFYGAKRRRGARRRWIYEIFEEGFLHHMLRRKDNSDSWSSPGDGSAVYLFSGWRRRIGSFSGRDVFAGTDAGVDAGFKPHVLKSKPKLKLILRAKESEFVVAGEIECKFVFPGSEVQPSQEMLNRLNPCGPVEVHRMLPVEGHLEV